LQHQLRETHPRPQLVREQWTDLCGQWGFAHDDDDIGLNEGWNMRDDVFNRMINVPFPPESQASGIDDPEPHPVVWYRRTFHVDSGERKDRNRLLLHFGAVDYSARVWVNGQLVAEHQGGHSPFTADITDALRPVDAEQVVVVQAEDDPRDLEMPRGKQDWQTPSHGIWYKRTTGIWQPVWLETVPDVYITNVRWTPDVDRGSMGVQVQLNTAPAAPVTVRIRLRLHEQPLANETSLCPGKSVTRELVLFPGGVVQQADKILWSPEQPNLIDAEITLSIGEHVIDRALSYAGMRSITIGNRQFRLNNQAYFLRMVLGQNYWPESHLAAPSADALRREVELIKELGFNGVRIHQKVEDPRFLYWCDRLGLVVWGEMANAYRYSPDAAQRLIHEWMAILRRDYSHPCIVTWVPLNESWGVPSLQSSPEQRHYLQTLYHLTRALDSTRPVISNDGWEHVQSDIWSVHDYTFDGDDIRRRYHSEEALEHTLHNISPSHQSIPVGDLKRLGEPVMITEYGGMSFAPALGEAWFGYGTVSSLEEYAAKYEELTTAILDCPTISGFCYTQLTDTEQETNGLLFADRRPKIDPERIREINSRPAASIPRETTAAHRKRAQRLLV
jgi:beta-galactosidase/beta-glucuronidase